MTTPPPQHFSYRGITPPPKPQHQNSSALHSLKGTIFRALSITLEVARQGQRLASLYPGKGLSARRRHLRRSGSPGPAQSPVPVAPSSALQPGPDAQLLTLHQPVPGEGGGAAGDQSAGDTRSHCSRRPCSAPALLPPWTAPLRPARGGDDRGTRSGRGRALSAGEPTHPPSASPVERAGPRCVAMGTGVLPPRRRLWRPHIRGPVSSTRPSHGAG